MTWRLGIFAVALVPRLVIAFVTFGAVDNVHNIRNFVRMLDGLRIETPYLPGLELVLWVAGMATYETPLPVLFPWKVLPLVCDALIALLLFDATRDRRAGLLYALLPVPLFIACVHPQWDSLFLLPLLLAVVFADEKPVLAGVALVVSIVAKPVAIPLAILLVPRSRRGALRFIGGAAVATIIYVVTLAATGHMPDLQGIVQYASGGVQVFGLTFRPHNRIIPVAGALALAAFLWFRNRCMRGEAVLLFFAVVLGLSGLSVQYLGWILPFAVLCRRDRFVALYGLAAGLFVLFYYQVPEINLFHIEDLGALAMLKPLGRLAPPPPPAWAGVALQILGNAVVPLLLLGFAALEVVKMLMKRAVAATPVGPMHGAERGAIAAAALFALAAAWAAMQPRIDPMQYVAHVDKRVEEYDVVRYRGPHIQRGLKVWIARSLVEEGVAHRAINAATLGVLWILLASGFAAISSRADGRRDGS